MKKITIYQENSKNIVLFDNDSSDLKSYTKKISEVFESTKVCILETSSGTIILKPSKINLICVGDENVKSTDEKNFTIHQDIIKD